MFLNDTRFVSDRIAIILRLLTRLNSSSSENPLLEISDRTRLEMVLGESSIDYLLCVHRISQCMPGVKVDKIIPLFAVESLDHNCYPGVKNRYLLGDPAMVDCNLLDLRGLLSSEDKRQQYLGLTSSTPPSTENCVSNTQTQPPPIGRPQPRPSQSPTLTSSIEYPPPMGFPWNYIS